MRDLSRTDLEWNEDHVADFDAVSFVDKHSAVDGTFRSQRDLRIEGEFKGNVSCDGTMFIAEGATVAATIEVEHLTVAGDMTGEVHCRGRLQILPSGRVRARVMTASLVIQEGAVYEGQLEMVGVERSGPRPLRPKTPAQPTGIEASGPNRVPGAGTTFIRRLGAPEAPWESARSEQGANGETEESGTEPAG